MVLTTESTQDAVELIDVMAMGRGDLGYGPEGIGLMPGGEGLVMPQGKDIFIHACREMVAATRTIAERSEIGLDDLSLIVMHQANKRILDRAVDLMNVPSHRVPVTIDKLGNTGCAGVAITYGRYSSTLPRGGWAALVTFGGGYSVGAALLRRGS
jgi:3-oxoacyl-[acyl-carrier-protein] synthase-3